MKKIKLALIVLLTLAIAQPVMANGHRTPPSMDMKAMRKADTGFDFIQWLHSWF